MKDVTEDIIVDLNKKEDNVTSDTEHNSDVESGSEAESAIDEGSEIDTDDDVSVIDEDELSLGGNNRKHHQQSGGADPDIDLEDEGEGEGESGDEEEDDDYLQKFNQEMRDDLILNFHPEAKSHNYEEIKQLAKVTRNKNGIIVDELHKTIPLLTKYEKTRILGQRAKQIECGAIPLVQVPPNIVDSYLIAKLELEQNKIPFIIRRPLPNGGMEYWYVSDLDNL